MKKVNVIFSDVDGTISDREVIRRDTFQQFVCVLKEFEAREKSEIHLILASGRPAPYLQGIQLFARGDIHMPYAIAENGSLLVIEKEHGFEYEMLMPQKYRDTLFSVKAKLRKMRQVEGFRFSVERGKEYSISVKWEEGNDPDVFCQAFDNLMEEYFDRYTLKQITRVRTSDSIDIFGATTSKADAVEEVIKRYERNDEYSIEDYIYLGDSHNDLKAGEFVNTYNGNIIVPENATQQLKDIAKHVGKGVALVGIVDALKKYFNI